MFIPCTQRNANGKSLAIKCVVSSCVIPNHYHTFPCVLSDILYVSCITKNLLSVSKFLKENSVVFEFIANKFYVKSQVTAFICVAYIIFHDW